MTTTLLDPASAYLRNEVESADPAKLVVMLYNRAISEMESAREMLNETSPEAPISHAQTIDTKLGRVREIINYLYECLDRDAGEVADQLAAVYIVATEQVLTAQMERDSAPLDTAIESMKTVRQGWIELAESLTHAGE